MKTTRMIKPDEKLSLVYTIGSFIAARGPVTTAAIRYEVRSQYIGDASNADIIKAIETLMDNEAAEFYDGAVNCFVITNKTVNYIEDESVKYEKR